MFSLQLSQLFSSRLMRPLALLAVAALSAPGAALASSPWTGSGSMGAIDESCYLAVQMDNSEARLAPGLLLPCKIRYQVTDSFGSLSTATLAMFAHIRDNSVTAGKVVVRLYEYPNGGGTPAGNLMATIDSDMLAGTPIAATGFTRYRFPAACAGAMNLNFTANTYWIEVDMTPALLPALPGLAIGSLQLRNCS
ncbi:hypothetical protein NHH73_02495 [Oxalobacteraceae bacterium OTU3CINTB1]|nr:hypothetical protein NHH73_02495 [Oxalobacteraceae bacterium OTU3CINTB1]